MTKKLDFHTPVINPYSTSKLDWLEEKADLYLSCTPRVARVISPLSKDKVTLNSRPLTLRDQLVTACKIASYVLLFPAIVFIALPLKLHRKFSHNYRIDTPSSLTSPHLSSKSSAHVIILDDDNDTPTSSFTHISSAQDLTQKRFLEHCTIGTVLTRVRDRAHQKPADPYFFIERYSLQTDVNKPFTLTHRKKTPQDMKVLHPTSGGLCLSIHDATKAHFTALFVDFKSKKIVYYDSFGAPNNARINDTRIDVMIDKVKNSVFDHNVHHQIEIIKLSKQHQYDGYNCGRYVIHFLKTMMLSQDLKQTIYDFEDTGISKTQLERHVQTWIKDYFPKS